MVLLKHLKLLLVCVSSCFVTLGAKDPHIKSTLCRPDLCPRSQNHLGCLSNNTFGKKCGDNNYIINVNGGLRLSILDRINVMRNYIASGAGHLPAAARMPTMGWDTNLQRLADLQARQCDENGWFCANTDKYHYVATTETKVMVRWRTVIHHVILVGLLPELFLDVLGCKMGTEYRLEPIKQGSCVGHYVPLIEDHGDRMGCALRLKTDKNTTREDRTVELHLICHFSRSNVNRQKHYEEAKDPTSKCVTGPNHMYPYLCSTDEVVVANEIMEEPAEAPRWIVQKPPS